MLWGEVVGKMTGPIRYARPISQVDDVSGVTTWLWADNDGLHCGSTPPAGTVPTGHVWGWGPGVRVHLRQDAIAPATGIMLVDSAQPDFVEVETMPLGTAAYPKTVLGQDRYLRCAGSDDEDHFSELRLDVVVVVAPTHALLVGERDS